MSFVGRPLSLAVVAALVVLAVGTVGATVLYSSGVSEVDAQNDQLRAQNEQLREDLSAARDRIETLRSRVGSLQRRLDARNATVAEVRTERDEARADLRAVCDRVRETNGSLPEEGEDVGSG